MYQSLERPGQHPQSAQKPQTSYREQLRAQMRDNYVQNRSEKLSRASAHETQSRKEAARFDTDYTPQLRAQQRGRFGSAGPQPGPGDLRRENAAPEQQQLLRRTAAAEKTPSEARSRTGRFTEPAKLQVGTFGPADARLPAEARSEKAPSQKSGSTTLSQAELICDNCINRHMIDDRQVQAKNAQQQDREVHQRLVERDRAQREREEAEQQVKKEQFRKEATAHWEESKRLKQLQREEEKRTEEAMRALMKNDGLTEKQIRELADRRRDQFRSDLQNQIRERQTLEEQQRRDDEAVPNSGLPIGLEYVNRFERYKDAHKSALKEQMEEKLKRKIQEKELEQQLQSQYVQEMKDFQEAERAKREDAERARKEHYRQEMERFQLQRDAKKRQTEEERLRDLQVEELNREKVREEDDRRKDAERLRERAHVTALKDQVEAARERRKAEEQERKNFQVGILKPEPICRLFDCAECHRQFPPGRLNKLKHSQAGPGHRSAQLA